LIYKWKSGNISVNEIGAAVVLNRNDHPAGPEVTGTRTFSAYAEKPGALIAVCGVIPDARIRSSGGVALEESRYRDIKGVISGILQLFRRA
jgi:hypothetical protein